MSTTPVGLPDRSPYSVFEEGLSRGELRYQRCGSCASAIYFPRLVCPACGSNDLGWATSTGRGEVYATTAVRRREETYNVALIDLEEGFRMMATVVGVPPDEVRIGARVVAQLTEGLAPGELVFEKVDVRG